MKDRERETHTDREIVLKRRRGRLADMAKLRRRWSKVDPNAVDN
jgi:hypothetical protein